MRLTTFTLFIIGLVLALILLVSNMGCIPYASHQLCIIKDAQLGDIAIVINNTEYPLEGNIVCRANFFTSSYFTSTRVKVPPYSERSYQLYWIYPTTPYCVLQVTNY